MQIGNNRLNGPQPHDRKNTPLDPDLTKVNREGIEKSSRETSEKTREAIEERSPARRKEAAQGRDTFERSRPQDDAGVSVEERLANARAQRREATAERAGNAREQRGERIEGARTQNTEAREARRVANARDQRAKQTGDENLKASGDSSDTGKRVENARTQRSQAEKAERIANARQQRAKVEGTQNLSRESVELSGPVSRLAGGELPGPGGVEESVADRQVRFDALRKAYQSGELNSPERLRKAAARLLGE